MALNPSSITSIGHLKYHSSFSVSVPEVSSSNITLYESYIEKGVIGKPICNSNIVDFYKNYVHYN